MAKVAQKKRVTKRTAKTRVHDARLLTQAEREASEGAAAAEPEGSPYVALPLAEVQSVLAQLRELTHTTIDAWACRDAMTDGLEDVLVSLHAARMNLESELTAALGRAGGES